LINGSSLELRKEELRVVSVNVDIDDGDDEDTEGDVARAAEESDESAQGAATRCPNQELQKDSLGMFRCYRFACNFNYKILLMSPH